MAIFIKTQLRKCQLGQQRCYNSNTNTVCSTPEDVSVLYQYETYNSYT